MAEELINAIENADEIFLQPLYDLSEAFAKDIQASFFWPFFPKFITVFGTTLLKVKDHPEVVQAGYTALTNIVRLIMRNVDQENEGQNDIKSLEVLTISLDGLMQNNKGLPVHSQKLCASALGQIIRRSKTKTSCIEVSFHLHMYIKPNFPYELTFENRPRVSPTFQTLQWTCSRGP